MLRVTILSRVVCDYRRAFYTELRRLLEAGRVELTLVGGAPRPGEFLVDDLEACGGVRGRNLHFLGKPYWTRGAVQAAADADLLVMEQANAALHNYWLMLRRSTVGRPKRTAYWGHGYSVDASGGQPIRTRLKTHLATKVDWWFAYTELTAHLLQEWGVSSRRITTVNNAIDTEALRDHCFRGTDAEREVAVAQLFPDQPAPGPIGVYCGRLIESKGIHFLLEAADAIRRRIPTFRFLLIGDGPLHPVITTFERRNSWFRWLGSEHGPERARVLSLGDVWLNPENLGLAVLDAFSMGIPVVAARDAPHGPEIAYLEDGRDGILTDRSVEAYADAVVALLTDPDRLSNMKSAARLSGDSYSAQEMANRFAAGVFQCLGEIGDP